MAQTKDIEPATEQPASPEPAGRVEFDSRGNSVWRWARDVLDSTSILLKRLENKDLSLEPTQKVPAMGAKKASKPRQHFRAGEDRQAATKSAQHRRRRRRSRPGRRLQSLQFALGAISSRRRGRALPSEPVSPAPFTVQQTHHDSARAECARATLRRKSLKSKRL